MIKIIEKYPIATLSIVIILMLLVHLDIPNVTIMEARNFITAREMVQDNNWLLTTMNGEPRYQKPPLPTWFTAVSGLIFGINNLFALRLPAALMVLFLGIFSYYFSLKLNVSKKHSFRNSLILVTSFYVFAILNEAPWDIYSHGFMLAGLYFLFQFFDKKKFVWKNIILSAIFIGLSIMSKGPVSLYAVFLPFLISYGIVFKFKNLKTKLLPLLSFIVLFILIGGWWFVYVRIVDSQAFLEIATKETGNWSSYNVKPFYYYWSFFTQSGLWTIPAFISLLYPYLINRIENKKAYKFTFWWTISAFILLSIIPEKKARYLMPVLIPLALNTGFYIQYLIKHFSKLTSKKETFPVYFNFGLIGLIAISLPIGLYIVLKNNFQTYLVNYILISIATIGIGVFIFIFLIKRKFINVFYLTILFMVSVFLFGLPISKYFNKNKDFKAINSLHLLEKENTVKTYSIGEITPELLWDYNGKLKDIYKNETLEIPSEDNFGLLLMNEDVEKITAKLIDKYNLQLTETYNLNVGSKNKERLIRQFYLVSKK
ncbi:4-amino-4-deoxy-L-arabinose transferase-like glycosyltransferase [Lutibacter oceani]|uniref:4-amino-4-deoxy-L-arabinose transferase-like glycosyltransferase n=1 Tax=Lutibacter oceani TaxID=1853311 RepID=A0A3D9RR23_9FLAO|nr:glycosyltransferase family 39 protein [Lutibacter oceani]REE79934.1 4-amino-4-deoxy-L-arabinose transferase-like glycosyltransferase [Lutibacter oceani]